MSSIGDKTRFTISGDALWKLLMFDASGTLDLEFETVEQLQVSVLCFPATYGSAKGSWLPDFSAKGHALALSTSIVV